MLYCVGFLYCLEVLVGKAYLDVGERISQRNKINVLKGRYVKYRIINFVYIRINRKNKCRFIINYFIIDYINF